MNDGYLTVNEIAKRFSVNDETVRRWIRTNKLKAIANSKKEGYLIKVSDLEEFVSIFNKKYITQSSNGVYRNEILKAIDFHKKEIERLTNLLKDLES